jgi:hypothetical protein
MQWLYGEFPKSEMKACAGAIQGHQIARGHASFIFDCEVVRVESLKGIKANVMKANIMKANVIKANVIRANVSSCSPCGCVL